MYDNLRDEAAATSIYEEDDAKFQPIEESDAEISFPRRSRRLFGMSSFQRFVIAIMLLTAFFVIGALCLLVTNKIGF